VVLSRRAAGLSLAGRLPRRQPLFGVAMAFVALVVTDKRVLTRGKVRGRPHKRACRATAARLRGIPALAPLLGAALPWRDAVSLPPQSS
jgi:hypothetical protein